MGRKVYVDSTVYNMAGDAQSRPHLLKQLMFSRAISGDRKTSFASSLMSHLKNSTGMSQRRFFKWASTHYDLGLPSALIDDAQAVTDTIALQTAIESTLTLGANEVVRVSEAVVDTADISYQAELWVNLNYPNLTRDDWAVGFDPAMAMILIDLPDNITAYVDPLPDTLWALDRSTEHRRLIYARYTVVDGTTGNASESAPALFTYRIGSGNLSLDALVPSSVDLYEFFPVLPLRLNNKGLRDASLSETYTAVTKAFKKLTGSSVDALLDQIEENENINELDYAFLVHGVSLNTADKAGQAYLFNFFETLGNSSTANYSDFLLHRDHKVDEGQSRIQWERWKAANLDETAYHPLLDAVVDNYLTQAQSQAPLNTLRVYDPDLPAFDYRMSWNYIEDSIHTGNIFTFDADQSRGLAKVGDYFITLTSRNDESIFMLLKQVSKTQYKKIQVSDLVHKNYIFEGHAVTITAADALADPEESGFLVPVHYPTMKSLGLVRGAQLATANSYLVLNAYEVQTTSWFQDNFWWLIAIVSIVLTFVFPPAAGLGSQIGILGSNASVGAMLGLSGTAAILAGMVANKIAAIILSVVISKVSVAVFGEKLGQVIAAFASFFAFQAALSYAQTGSFQLDWSEILSIDNLMQLTDVTTKAYSSWLNADTQDIYARIQDAETEYQDELEQIEQAFDEFVGVTNGLVDPMIFTETTETFNESRDTFLARTTLTGSELADLSFALIENFSEISLELPRYTV